MIDWDYQLHVFSELVKSQAHRSKFIGNEKFEFVSSKLAEHSKQFFIGFPITEYFSVCNGQDGGGEPIYDGFWLLDELIVEEHLNTVSQFFGEPLFKNYNEMDEYIKPLIASRSWFPLAMDGYGETLCIDFDPGKLGDVGQIIKVWHDSEKREVLASSLSKFLLINVGF